MIFGLKEQARLRVAVAMGRLYPERITRVELSRKLDMSLSYVELLLTELGENKLIDGIRGPTGGVWLTKSPDNILLSDVMLIRPKGKKFEELEVFEKRWASFTKAHSLAEII